MKCPAVSSPAGRGMSARPCWMTWPGWGWRAPSTSGSSPAAPPWRPCAWPTPRAFSPRNTSSPARSGWRRTSWSTPCNPPGGKQSWASASPFSPPGRRGSQRPWPSPATWMATPWSRPSCPPSGSTCSSTARSGKRSPCGSISTSAGPPSSQSSCLRRSSGRTTWSWAAPPRWVKAAWSRRPRPSGPASAPTSGRRPTGTTSSSALAAASSLPGTWPSSSSAAALGATWTAASGTPRALCPRTSREARIPSSWPSRRRSRRN